MTFCRSCYLKIIIIMIEIKIFQEFLQLKFSQDTPYIVFNIAKHSSTCDDNEEVIADTSLGEEWDKENKHSHSHLHDVFLLKIGKESDDYLFNSFKRCSVLL